MTQFVRKNIDIISSTSRPTTAQIHQRPASSSSELSELGEPMTPANSLAFSESGTLSAQMLGNYTFMPKTDPDHSTQSFRSALDHLPSDRLQLIGSSGTTATVLPEEESVRMTSFTDITHPIPGNYDAINPDVGPRTVGAMIFGLRRSYRRVRRWWDSLSGPSQEDPDLERQPLLPTDPDHPAVPTYESPYDRRRTYIVLGAVLVLVLFLIVAITGDPILLYMLRGILCYVLGRDVAGTLFGHDFCPAIESGNSLR